tara:strand:- start:272 stop:442 length:171 start_codon:yes stop_codon:yes gene_type:complete
MTAQIKEILLYKDGMASEHLIPYLQNSKDINFSFLSTAIRREYLGIWELRGKKVYN